MWGIKSLTCVLCFSDRNDHQRDNNCSDHTADEQRNYKSTILNADYRRTAVTAMDTRTPCDNQLCVSSSSRTRDAATDGARSDDCSDELATLNNAQHLYAGIVSTSATDNAAAHWQQLQLL